MRAILNRQVAVCPGTQAEIEMRFINESYRGISRFVFVNTDRFLIPLIIVASLTLAGWLVSLLQAF